MIDTKLLEAWCHNTENEALDWISQDRKMMAAEIRLVLAELKAAREVIKAAKHVVVISSTSNLIALSHALDILETKK